VQSIYLQDCVLALGESANYLGILEKVLKNSSCIYGQKKGKQIYTSNKEIEKKGNSPEGVLA